MGPLAPATAALAAALLLAACTGTAPLPPDVDGEQPGVATTSTASGGPRLWRVARPPSHLDPQRVDGAEATALARTLLHRTLVVYRKAPGTPAEPLPDLAVTLGRPSAGATVWTYTLRAGLRFEDGTPLTAGDVRHGLARLFARELHGGRRAGAAALFAVPGRYPGPYRATPVQRQAFERAVPVSRDGRTITFHLTRPVPDFDRWAASLALAPVPAATDTGPSCDGCALATGPYRVAGVVRGVSVVLSRNPAWSPALDPLRTNVAATVVVLAGRGRTATP